MKKLTKRIIVVVVLLCLSVAGIIVRNKTTILSKKTEFKTATVKKTDIKKTLSASGVIAAKEQAVLRFQTSGRLAWVGVKEGDYVEKWQAVASLDQRDLEKDLQKELLDYMDVRWDFEQDRDDYSVSSDNLDQYNLSNVAKRILQQNQFTLDRSVLDVEIKRIALEYSTLITPISGIVTLVEEPYAGVNITPANAEIKIANPDKLEIQVKVEEIDIGRVKIGQNALTTFDTYPDEELVSQVEAIDFSPTTVRGGGTAYIVKLPLTVNNREQKYKLGMNADIEIVLEEKNNILTVPIEAIKQRNGKTSVELLVNDQLQETTIETGIETEDEIEVTAGLKEDDKIVIQKKD